MLGCKMRDLVRMVGLFVVGLTIAIVIGPAASAHDPADYGGRVWQNGDHNIGFRRDESTPGDLTSKWKDRHRHAKARGTRSAARTTSTSTRSPEQRAIGTGTSVTAAQAISTW
jgi:hypothetical protein